MTELGTPESPAERVLYHALEKLRARDGVNLARLQATANGPAAPLLTLDAVRRYSTVHEIELPRAAVEVIAECVREALNGTDRIVADAVLALGLFADAYRDHGIDPRAIEDMRSGLLSSRRRAMLRHWQALQAAIGVPATDPPSDRTLRGSWEAVVLTELARQLIRREVLSFGSHNAQPAVSRGGPAHSGGRSGRVVVVGGAVMDVTFKTKNLPARETSIEALDFRLVPGGKGLTQAVAAARLGLDVSLLAAVADDRFGHEILDYLRGEHVDISMMKVVPDARTPFTGIIQFELGDSVAVNWRNEREVRLDIRDVDKFESELMASDAVLMTFELPRESLQYTLSLLHREHSRRPMTVVTPSQPYVDEIVSGQALAQIDYLVAHPWELGQYMPQYHSTFDVDVVARRLLAIGVETLCIPLVGGCSVYSEALGTFTVPAIPSAYKESSASRDAFCAALAAKLIDGQNTFSEEVAFWATAAMAAAAADHPLPNPMPSRQRVEQLLARSRFTVQPRAQQAEVNDAGAGDPLGPPAPSDLEGASSR